MRVVMVLRDEFKRSSWLFVILLACFFLAAADLLSVTSGTWKATVIGGDASWYIYEGVYSNFIPFYLIAVVLLALCQSRKRTDDFWNSLPYTAGELYVFRLLYGALVILFIAVVQLGMTAVIVNKFGFFMKDFALLGISTEYIYRTGSLIVALFGAYIIATLVYKLVNNRFAASIMLFFLALIPELLVAPCDWLGGIFLDGLEVAANIKYAAVFGIYIPYIVKNVYTVGVPVYAAVTVIVFLIGYYVSRRNTEKGNEGMFYNGIIKAVFILLCLLFALNVVDTLFVQGGVM